MRIRTTEAEGSLNLMRPHGEKFRQRRKQLGLSQKAVAVEAGVSRRTVQNVESSANSLGIDFIEAIADVLDLSEDEMLIADEEAVELRCDPGGRQDACLGFPWSLFGYLQTPVLPADEAFCESESDAEQVIRKMRRSWTTHLGRSQCGSQDDRYAAADRDLDQLLEDWDRRYINLWKQNKRTLYCSTVNKKRTGVSVVLPVSDRAYERLLAGDVTFMDIRACDIQDDSQNLILDSAVEFPSVPRCPWYKVTESLGFGAFTQVAMLAQDPAASDFRMLSFGASPSNIERLKRIGFVQQEATMPRFGFPLFEFSERHRDLTDESGRRSMAMANVLHMLRRCLSSATRARTRRAGLRQALKMYQRFVKSAGWSSQRPAKKSAA
jgi:transcriptional regulator with XRE-family HTH domain